MGYNTTYALKWEIQGKFKDKPRCEHAVPPGASFCPVCGTPIGLIGVDEQVANYIKARPDDIYWVNPDGSSTDSTKGYEHEKQMRDMSAEIKGVLFTLHGEGEESGDIWNKYFLNGKMQVAKATLVFDEFDAKKLY